MSKQCNIFEDLLHQPDPQALAAHPDLVPFMTSSPNRNGYAGTADRQPMVYRAGSQDALKLPSRMANRLHYPDGRILPA